MAQKYPGNGLYVVQGEISSLMTSLRKVHWSARSYQEDENNPLLKQLAELKVILNQFIDLREIELITYLGPFLDVIRSNETSIQVTVLALSSVNKFISYGLVGGIAEKYLLPVIDNIADAVSHANFITTDHPSDTVILMKIVEVLRTLVLSPLGRQLSNDSICEIMLSCFRICFETRLNELLRHSAEHCLKDIVQLLFNRLPMFTQSTDINLGHYKKMRIRPKSVDNNQKKKKQVYRSSNLKKNVLLKNDCSNDAASKNELVSPVSDRLLESENQITSKKNNANKPEVIPDNAVELPVIDQHENSVKFENVDSIKNHKENGHSDKLEENNRIPNEMNSTVDDTSSLPNIVESNSKDEVPRSEESNAVGTVAENNERVDVVEGEKVKNNEIQNESSSVGGSPCLSVNENNNSKQYVNPQGVRFMSDDPNLEDWLIAERIPLEPHNSICIQELLRFLALICNPYDKQNTDIMIHISLSLLTIALEVGADAISKHPTLLTIIKDTLCRNLLSLLNTERMQIFTSTLHVSFLLFESMRNNLKFQLEYFLSRLSEIIVTDTSKVSYDKKELALESLVQLWKIPGLVTELFINYDCDLYCPNLYEEITKLLSKNVYPVAGIYNTHLLSLDALLTIVETIEKHCHSRISNDKIANEQNSGYHEAGANAESSMTTASINENEKPFSNTILSDDKRQINHSVTSHEQLMAIKRKKKLLATGTEHFNVNPKKGIQFMQEQGLLSSSLEPSEVSTFLKENPHLDKKTIGEFISRRSNLKILEHFVKSFDFTDMRIDVALRLFLEAFRLPGESPLVTFVMELFADHWHKSNGEPFSKSDAAFVLAYAIIMLNTDQHNQVARRQQSPMTVEDFKKNVKGVDNGKDFDQDLLEAIYQSIKNEEIVMPAEHTGIVRENYLWKVLLRRGSGKDGIYIRAKDGLYDHELFSLCWGPVVTALSYVFDKSADSSVYSKSMQGFRKCATISAHYAMINEFDYLTLSLCKFTMLLNPIENPDSFTVSFGMNEKARLVTTTVFSLVHRHGDVLREGWRPIFDCIFQLFRCKLLPKILVEAEDFLELSGKVSLVREDVTSQKITESSLLSSLYSYITLATEASSQRITTDKEKEYVEIAKTCIVDCHLENLILESKFLRLESLHELLKVLIKACYDSDGVIIINCKQDEDKAIFFLEILLKVVIQNRDRVGSLWQTVCDHLYTLLMAATAAEQQFLIERCVIGLLRLAIRLMRREEITSSVLQSLQMLFLLKWSVLFSVSRQIAYGLHELLKTGAANIHSEADWAVIFTLLEVVGGGAPLPKLSRNNSVSAAGSNDGKSSEDTNTEGAAEDSGSGYDKQYLSSSDSSLNHLASSVSSPTDSYLFINNCNSDGNSKLFFSCNELLPHDPFSLVKCCESLAFLVRDVAHITPFNFENCVHSIRTFVETTLYTGERKPGKKKTAASSVNKPRARSKISSTTKKTKLTIHKNHNNPYDADESDPEEYPDSYYQAPLQLLDLMHSLHTKTAHIYKWWAEENAETEVYSLWPQGWCPLLQGIARLCCDPRKSVRMSAITYLQRALLTHDLQTLTANEWESCFNNVLFPLLEKLLEPFQGKDYLGVEETRMRAATLLSKVFLQHLTPLQSLSSFESLWLKILDFMDSYMNIDKNSDLLNEAIQECVKNMILVMESAKLFNDDDAQSPFWISTWGKVDKFLPNLRDELYRYHSTVHEYSDQSIQFPHTVEHLNEYRELKCGYDKSSHGPTHTDVSLVKHSIPIFPHMGKLISTPIGPPNFKPQVDKFVNDCCRTDENVDSPTQISSLIASDPDFLASLPSFRPTSPSTENSSTVINRSFAGSPSLDVILPVSPERQMHRQYEISYANCDQRAVDLSGVQSHRIGAETNVPFICQHRSSSVSEPPCAENDASISATLSEITRTLSNPVLFSGEPIERACDPYCESFAVHSVRTETDLVQDAVSNNSNTKYRVLSLEDVNSSPSKSSLPVYSGFAQLSSDNNNVNNCIEANNAKQFFYRNW